VVRHQESLPVFPPAYLEEVEACYHVVVVRSVAGVDSHSLERRVPKDKESAFKALLAKLNVAGWLVVA